MREEKNKIIDEIYETLMAGEEPEDAVMIKAVDLDIDIRFIRDIVEAMLDIDRYVKEDCFEEE